MRKRKKGGRRERLRKGRKEEVERDLQVLGVGRWRELVAGRKKMEGHCSTGQSPQWAVVPVEEEEVTMRWQMLQKPELPTNFCDQSIQHLYIVFL